MRATGEYALRQAQIHQKQMHGPSQLQQEESHVMDAVEDDRRRLIRELTRKSELDRRRCSPSPLSSHASSRCNSPALQL